MDTMSGFTNGMNNSSIRKSKIFYSYIYIIYIKYQGFCFVLFCLDRERNKIILANFRFIFSYLSAKLFLDLKNILYGFLKLILKIIIIILHL